MKTQFNIDGEPTISYIGPKAFEDKMTWGPEGELILVKTNKEDGTEITAIRIKKGKTMVMVSPTPGSKDRGQGVYGVKSLEASIQNNGGKRSTRSWDGSWSCARGTGPAMLCSHVPCPVAVAPTEAKGEEPEGREGDPCRADVREGGVTRSGARVSLAVSSSPPSRVACCLCAIVYTRAPSGGALARCMSGIAQAFGPPFCHSFFSMDFSYCSFLPGVCSFRLYLFLGSCHA
jgi:hypothetical protein